MKTASTVLLVWMVGSFTALAASPSSDFQAALDQARLNSQTNPGHDYEIKVRMMIHKVLSEAIKECAGPQSHWRQNFRWLLLSLQMAGLSGSCPIPSRRSLSAP